MAPLTLQQEQTLTAFITALSQQTESLPTALQAQLQSIGHNLENRVMELRVIAASLPSLDQAYRKALAEQPQTGDEPRATLVSSLAQDDSAEYLDYAVHILTGSDPVQAAQQDSSNLSGQIASNPLKRFFRRG
ncbi:hypothetical protein [Acaryochloris sp. CCMEE 5410]|uniref:hypothetical protein n=1 Tax=Acaryochloris sp. CCMEE 5410 TaxID=310037 RepID=UPI0002484ECF|nr:hypothetical protein [Acaryochloris sp. CCMEE 5410]KAI9132293.1 hypothetical protein ON05_002125 [Acaryochloris sp. CCMEE 5410]